MTVLRDGKIAAANEPIDRMSRGRLVSLMIGREERAAHFGRRDIDQSNVVLEARKLATSLGHRDIDFSLHQGEILGLYGLVGAGRSELARALVGDAAITAGELRVRGQAGATSATCTKRSANTASASSARTASRRA